ncbi:MAG: DUF1669 domain-containing protein [Elusimicrobia bacterium]|nr:DUF1669 domain-containing protein [Elusimicrobiota bacterium]
MRRIRAVALALIVAGPTPAFAGVVAPIEGRITVPVSPAAGAFSPTLQLGTFSPSLTVPTLAVPAPSLAPSLIPSPVAAAAVVMPSALSASPVAALAAHVASAVSAAPAAAVPKTALQGLQTELEAPAIDASDFAGDRDHAARSFDAKLGIEAYVPAALAAFTEGAFHPLAKIKTAPPPASGDDGGGPTTSRPVEFNGQTFPSVAFRPNEPVESHIIRAIENAKESIQLSLYEFTSRGILKALLAAKKRGVKLEIILCDSAVNPRTEPLTEKEKEAGKTQYTRYRSEQIWALIRNGVDVTVIGRPTKYGINHHKFAVFDGKLAEFGSYNWTYTSEKNHWENVLFSNETDRVKAYQDVFKYLRSMSVSVAESATKEWPLDVPAPPKDASAGISFNGIKLPKWVFMPAEGFEDALAAAIDASKVSVDAGQFVLESRKIADALERALKRGVKVRVVADKSQTQYDHVQLFLGHLQRLGAQIHILFGPNGEDSDYPMAEKMHNKYFVFDGKVVETGSANATKNAGVNNFENANFLDDKTDVAAYVKTFEHMFAVSETAPAFPEGALPTDEQMRENVLQPRGPPLPPPPGPAELAKAKRVAFNGVDFPSSAIRPNEPVEAELIKLIDSAKTTLDIGMYELNQQGIWDALQRAKKRGIKIKIVLDRSHVYTTGYEDDGTPRKPKQMVVDLIKDGGFEVILLKGRLGGIMHNKFIIADGGLVQFGSYNYTRQSEEDHWENVFFSIVKKRVAGYTRYFEYMYTHPSSEEPDLEKLDEVLTRSDAWTDKMDRDWDMRRSGSTAQAADSTEPEAAGRKKKPLPPDPPQETEKPITLNGKSFPLQMFSPNAGIEAALIEAIGDAKKSIQIAMFSFFSQPIAEALLAAKERGVNVQIVMDKSQTGTSKLDEWFAWHGFDLRTISGPDPTRDPRYQKMHNKFAIFDGKMLESGSFNFSSRAETLSFENANFFDDADEIARFTASFLQMYERGNAPRAPKREPKFAVPDAEPES